MGATAIGLSSLMLLFLGLGVAASSEDEPTPGPGPGPGPQPTPSDVPDRRDLELATCIVWASWGPLKPTLPDAVAAAALASLGVPGSYPADPDASEFVWAVWNEARTIAEAVMAGGISCGEDVLNPDVAPTPTPTQGGYYLLRQGDTPGGIARALFPAAGGGERIAIFRAINQHPRNVGLHMPSSSLKTAANRAYALKHYGPNLISFLPNWYRDPTHESQRFASGDALAVVYIPEFV